MLAFLATLNRAAQRLQSGKLFSGRRRRQAISTGNEGSVGSTGLHEPPPPQPRQTACSSVLQEGIAPCAAASSSSAYSFSSFTRSAESGTTPLGRVQVPSGEKSKTKPA